MKLTLNFEMKPFDLDGKSKAIKFDGISFNSNIDMTETEYEALLPHSIEDARVKIEFLKALPGVVKEFKDVIVEFKKELRDDEITKLKVEIETLKAQQDQTKDGTDTTNTPN